MKRRLTGRFTLVTSEWFAAKQSASDMRLSLWLPYGGLKDGGPGKEGQKTIEEMKPVVIQAQRSFNIFTGGFKFDGCNVPDRETQTIENISGKTVLVPRGSCLGIYCAD